MTTADRPEATATTAAADTTADTLTTTDTVTFTVDAPTGAARAGLRYERGGSGEPLLLVHGIGHRLGGWDPVAEALRERYDVIAVDLPGFGDSPRMPDALLYDLDGFCTVLAGFCRELGIERPHVAGNSLGGLIALELGRRGLARSSTALSPAGFYGPVDKKRALLALRLMRFAARALPHSLIEPLSRSTAGRALLTGTVYARPARITPEHTAADVHGYRHAPGFEATVHHSSSLRLRGDVPDVPVTIAWGSKDRLLPIRQGAAAKRLVPGAHLVRLTGLGHTPMADDPALVARVILDGAARTA
ncbi:alpha/beta fold hydrolase [Streptomyces sp. XM4193]|uniref:alpha/beta fold hydrolase n=1 Tax=Streptomyces sp. XM4193 TaxID=2929782 RepID=UPI001FF83CAB|nr:alpha/beta fold hydrolase [Streptomyces sp. XM4193]MCK1799127.1 alpha/beta fold hydrolase [Streptomyces sp. XM4193]